MWPYSINNWVPLTELSENAAVHFEEDKNLYILEIRTEEAGNPKAGIQRLVFDPARGYLTVREETVAYEEGQKIHTFTNDWLDLHQINGLWVPMKIVWFDDNVNMRGEYAVQSIRVNESSSRNQIKIEFPEGTQITDHILGVEYRTRQKESPDAFLGRVAESSQGVSSILPPAATDEQLAEAASKGRQLLQQQTEAGDKKSLAIYPEYVWIEPGRKEYILTLGEEKDRRPTLKSHQFAGGGLVLHELKDQISENGQIRLTIERPAAMTGYGEGTLELDFAGERKTIHLVAPPLLN
jgi:hypothetical protein